MWRTGVWTGVLLVCCLQWACESGRHSAAGFRLPSGGSAQRGKAVFLALNCRQCHDVSGVPMERAEPAAATEQVGQQPVRVQLGGFTSREMTDGYLVTAIIHPSYRLAQYPHQLITVDGRSRMPEQNELTVQELVDLVTFLQSTYHTSRPFPDYPAYY
jgi:L-cysteine S-thiosulfotransferase